MKRGVIVGTAGHVDHGKSALVRALTGVETDRWAEERERGLTIDIGFAHLPGLPGLDAGIVDVPGHEDFVKNMLAGCTGVDVLLLVVAADEGPMPQTREHLMIARLLGLSEGVVALNKVDRVDEGWLELVRAATRDELRAVLGHDRWPIIEVSATTGQGLDTLLDGIAGVAERVTARDRDDLFRMPVDRTFSVKGAGTVVTGTTWSGEVSAGERVRVLPGGAEARVRSLQVHGGDEQRVGPGRRCALALVGIAVADAGRGSVIVSGAGWRASTRLGARVEIPESSKRSVEHGQRVRLYLGTREVMARVLTIDREPVLPGGGTWALLDCEEPVVGRVRDHFILRFYSPVTTIGGGRVCALDPPRAWRRQRAQWEALAGGSEVEATVAAVRLAGGRGVREDELPLVTGLSPATVKGVLESQPHVTRVEGAWYDEEVVRGAAADVLSCLEETHGRRRRESMVSLESLRAALTGRYAPQLLDHAITRLTAAGSVCVDGPGIRLAGHEAGLSADEALAVDRILETLAEAGLAPPGPSELSTRLALDRYLLNDLLRLLEERGEIIQVSPDIYLTRREGERATNIVRSVAGERPTPPGSFRDALGVTRKYLIPLLEYMDRTGVTRRTPEGRVASGD